jgi:hypothetical protein
MHDVERTDESEPMAGWSVYRLTRLAKLIIGCYVGASIVVPLVSQLARVPVHGRWRIFIGFVWFIWLPRGSLCGSSLPWTFGTSTMGASSGFPTDWTGRVACYSRTRVRSLTKNMRGVST